MEFIKELRMTIIKKQIRENYSKYKATVMSPSNLILVLKFSIAEQFKWKPIKIKLLQ